MHRRTPSPMGSLPIPDEACAFNILVCMLGWSTGADTWCRMMCVWVAYKLMQAVCFMGRVTSDLSFERYCRFIRVSSFTATGLQRYLVWITSASCFAPCASSTRAVWLPLLLHTTLLEFWGRLIKNNYCHCFGLLVCRMPTLVCDM